LGDEDLLEYVRRMAEAVTIHAFQRGVKPFFTIAAAFTCKELKEAARFTASPLTQCAGANRGFTIDRCAMLGQPL
jgi:hypothetical protein